MFSKPAEPRSIASQLAFRFTLAAALLLCFGLVVLYLIVVRHAFEEDNVFLADRISALRADLKNLSGPKALQEQLRVPQLGKSMTYWIRTLDATGRLIAETPGMNEMLPQSIFPEARDEGAITKPKDYRAHGKLFSLAATKETTNGRSYLIQVGQDRTVDEEFTKQFGALLVVVLIFGILLSAMIAARVTKRGLRPLTELTRSLKRVGPTHLHERAPLTGWPRELQPLAAAFDDMLDRLEDSFTRLSQFSADIAHELRTPVANIRGEAEVALTRPRSSDEYREVIESNVGECERLSGIIDNLLFLARAEAAEGHIQCTLIDGPVEIAKIASFYEAIADEQQITISCRGEGSIYADPVLFGRAVSNLVENALGHTPSGGAITISVEARGSDSVIRVKDTGCGIPSEHIARVFDRFYRVDPARSSKGAGLGLALVKSISELHGGSAEVDSEVAKGTVVTLSFPCKPVTTNNL
jgi:two-component system, OmpR family, heavy metal sensor histidine kinase CusS